MGKTIALVVSITLNAAAFAFVAMALSSHTSSLAYYNMDDEKATYTTAALLVTIPLESSSAVFGPVEIALSPGERGALQLSAVIRGRQANWLLAALYDRSVIRVDATAFGVEITALEPGETVMQVVSDDGIQDLAVVRVLP
jgi:hypothetical protein